MVANAATDTNAITSHKRWFLRLYRGDAAFCNKDSQHSFETITIGSGVETKEGLSLN
jgi:hypothetical protein